MLCKCIMSGCILIIVDINFFVALCEPYPCLSHNIDLNPWHNISNLFPILISVDRLGLYQRPYAI